MQQEPILILDRERIRRKLQRMAWQIWEHNSEATSLQLIGISGGGQAVAESLATTLRAIGAPAVTVTSLQLNKRAPLTTEPHIDANLNGQAVVLVDDVANSGKTLLYALRPVLQYEPSRVMIAVLVDRRHKAYPIMPDIVGHSLATTLQDHIDVQVDGNEVTGVYLQ